ncbi:LuxR family transcriptional regulator [Streptomyces sp. L2]|uniref:helix-turn-helix transcriptional regulator n=1 Tax=Streptomyces sp. L2 TaxID=2162665 RepID=UPI0010107917|nr:LuxR family transcriptional regulator [Streptomyces sp. L2]
MLDLSCLGLSTEDVRAYECCLKHPRSTAESTAEALGTEPDQAQAVLGRLTEFGLLRADEDGSLKAVDPVIGIERLVEQRFAELNDELRRVSSARGSISALAESFRQGSARDTPLDIERLTGLREIRERLDDLAFFAHNEVLGLQPGGAFEPEMIAACRPLDLRCLRRGLTLRTIVSREAVEDPLTLAYLREIVAQGAQVRYTDQSVERLIIYDGSLAVLPVDPADSARGALVVRQAGVVQGMVNLFEQVWAGARCVSGAGAAQETLSEAEREVLRVLCEVEKDEVGARRMGVSLRTFRRYVADLMTRLGASNRFQAAVIAKERGWL